MFPLLQLVVRCGRALGALDRMTKTSPEPEPGTEDADADVGRNIPAKGEAAAEQEIKQAWLRHYRITCCSGELALSSSSSTGPIDWRSMLSPALPANKSNAKLSVEQALELAGR